MSNKFVEINPDDFNYSAFKLIAKDWLQITAKADDRVNTMTASWGGVGQMWGKNAAFIFIRPQRFTKTLVDKSDVLTLQVLPESLRKTNSYFGRVTGFDEDKIKASGVTVLSEGEHVYFDESDVVLFCRKMYAQELNKESFIDKINIDKWYPQNDYHTMYVVAIEKLLVSENFKKSHNL